MVRRRQIGMACCGAVLVWRSSEGESCLIRARAVRLAAAVLLPICFAGSALAQGAAPPQATRPATSVRPAPAPAAPMRAGGTIQAIKVEGNQRIESGTIRSYMLVQPGDPFDPDRLDRSLKTLYATGLFQDVRLTREGDTVVVHVVENPL